MNTALKTTTVTSDADGLRLDVFLSGCIPGLTRSAASKLLESGRVTLGGAVLRKSHKTSRGEVYTVIQDEPVSLAAAGQDIRLDVVFEDEDIIVVNKPRGMVVHPAPGHADGTLVNALLFHCGGSLSGIGGVLRPGIVHRIDKDTSGLIISAKNDNAHLSLTAQLADRTLTREYDAVVCGCIKAISGTIDAPLGRHATDRKRQAVRADGRYAVTHYEVIERYGKGVDRSGYTYVRCRLETGRTHQIRVHMAHIGHPVLGDKVYGRKRPELQIDGQCLHARRLRFRHPASGENMELYTDLPDYFTQILGELRHENA